MDHIFLDTNIFIHCQDFEQIDWAEALGLTGEFTILLAPVVLEELDKHKYNSNRKISARIRKLLPKIESFVETPSLCRHNFLFVSKKPTDDIFSTHGLDKKEQDDSLLATIIEYSNSIELDDSVIYVTNDIGPRLKAKSHSIPSPKLLETYLLKNEPDEIEKQNITLQKELNELKNRIPIVNLTFDTKEEFIIFNRKPEVYSKAEYIEREMAKIKGEFYPLVYNPGNSNSVNKMTALDVLNSQMFALSEDQINRYNSELNEFYEKFKSYALSLYDRASFGYNCCEVKLLLQNIGSSPATDIDIQLHFPDGFNLVDKDGFPIAAKKPEPPRKPKNRFDFYSSFSLGELSVISPRHQPNLKQSDFNVSGPTIKKTNSFEVSYSIKNLKHNQSANLETLFLKYDDIKLARGFNIDYKIMVANIPKLLSGQLHVTFES